MYKRDIELNRDRNSSSARNETTIDMLWRVRPSIRFCLSSCVVRSKGEAFPSRHCKLKNLTLCNQKHRLLLYLLGKCFAPTNPAESLGNRTPYQFPVPSSQLIHVTVLIIRGASHGSALTIDLWWAVILNEAKRNEESLSSVATLEGILLPPRRDQNDRPH